MSNESPWRQYTAPKKLSKERAEAEREETKRKQKVRWQIEDLKARRVDRDPWEIKE